MKYIIIKYRSSITSTGRQSPSNQKLVVHSNQIPVRTVPVRAVLLSKTSSIAICNAAHARRSTLLLPSSIFINNMTKPDEEQGPRVEFRQRDKRQTHQLTTPLSVS